MLTRPLLALLGALAAGCAAGPWAELSGRPGASPALDVVGTVIVGVDGQLLFEHRDTWRVSPGTHEVLVTTARKRPNTLATSQAIAVDARPCTRYYIVARHANALDVTHWSPEVLRSEPISGCKAR